MTLVVSLPAYLYSLAKYFLDRCVTTHRRTRSSTSKHRTVDLASGLSGYAPLLWENENTTMILHIYIYIFETRPTHLVPEVSVATH